MNFKQFPWVAVAILCLGFFCDANAQAPTTNYPFSWKETTDTWYKPKAYAFKYASDDLTEKGGKTTNKVSHGPVATNACQETTVPDACTESLLGEKLKDIEMPGLKLPAGYSGVEYVTFDIQANGKVGNYQVVKQDVLCKPCIQRAVNEVASLGEWHPAIQDGITVKSTVVVPVYFKR
jgi:hypothetical protein